MPDIDWGQAIFLLLVVVVGFIRWVGNLIQQQKEAKKRGQLSPEERATAVRAARAMGLNVCGVDMLRANHGPVVMEVNSSPGLEGIETSTGKDVAGMIVSFVEQRAAAGRTRTRGRG